MKGRRRRRRRRRRKIVIRCFGTFSNDNSGTNLEERETWGDQGVDWRII
jgi:hypothetical protein